MTRSVLVLTTLTTVAFGGYCAYLSNALESERAASVALRDQVTALEAALKAGASRPLPAIETPAPLQTPFTAAATTPAKPSVAPARLAPQATGNSMLARPTRESMQLVMDRQRELLNDPEYRAAMREQQKMGLRQMYPDLASATGLSSEQVDRMMELLAEQQLKSMEGSRSLEDPAQREQYFEQLRQQQRDNESAIAAEIGSDGLQKWKEYQASLGARFQVRNLRSQLEAAGVPLRDTQVEDLVSALRSAEKQMFSAPNMPGQRVAGGFNANDRSQALQQSIKLAEEQAQRQREAVRPYLSAEQFEKFEKLQEQEERMRKASMRMLQAQMEAMRGSQPGSQTGGNAEAAIITSPIPGIVSFNALGVIADPTAEGSPPAEKK
jgi:hypothetical protein